MRHEMDDPLEVELKLEFDPGDRGRVETFGPFVRADARTDHLVSVYYDTPDRNLAEAGYSLRIRCQGDRHVQTVKADSCGAAGLFTRSEWERPVPGETPVIGGGGDPLAKLLGNSAASHLQRLFVTDVRRTARRLDSDGAAIECAVDEGEIRAEKHGSAPLCEIELELREGPARALFDLARQLNEEVPLRLGVRSKAERGYRLVANERAGASKAEPVILDPDGGAGDAFRAIAQNCIRQFRLNETLLLQTGEAELLHQARVGIRRLRSAFSLFRPLIERDERAELLKVELRALAGAFGEVRNLDVLIPRFPGSASDRLRDARALAMEHLRTELRSGRTRLLMIDLAEWLAIGDWQAETGDEAPHRQGVTAFAAAILDDRRKKLKRLGRHFDSLDDAHRHRVRIEAKKLRYASEFFASLYPEKKRRHRQKAFLKALEGLQDCLGELNDLTIAPRILESLDLNIDLPLAGKGARHDLLDQAEDAFEALVEARPFWR